MHIDSYGNLFMNLKHKKRVQFHHLIFRFLFSPILWLGCDNTELNGNCHFPAFFWFNLTFYMWFSFCTFSNENFIFICLNRHFNSFIIFFLKLATSFAGAIKTKQNRRFMQWLQWKRPIWTADSLSHVVMELRIASAQYSVNLPKMLFKAAAFCVAIACMNLDGNLWANSTNWIQQFLHFLSLN